MPVPKRKRSRARRDSRFANKGIAIKANTGCHQCSAPIPTHTACKECGYYKGVKVLVTKADRAQKRGEVRSAQQARTQQAAQSADAASEQA